MLENRNVFACCQAVCVHWPGIGAKRPPRVCIAARYCCLPVSSRALGVVLRVLEKKEEQLGKWNERGRNVSADNVIWVETWNVALQGSLFDLHPSREREFFFFCTHDNFEVQPLTTCVLLFSFFSSLLSLLLRNILNILNKKKKKKRNDYMVCSEERKIL